MERHLLECHGDQDDPCDDGSVEIGVDVARESAPVGAIEGLGPVFE